MLINTVLLFLENILPVLILATLLIIIFPGCTKLWLFQGVVVAIFALTLLTYLSQDLSEIFSGNGLEICYAFGYLFIYLAVVLLVLSPNQQFLLTKQRLIAFVIIILVFSLNNTSFSWYLLNYTNENKPLESLLLGLILGGGIGLSVAILLYFFLDWVRNRFSTTTPLIFLFLFAAGQLIRGIKLLAQVDLWPETPLLFNFSGWLPAQSILAPLFSVIFGYQERMTQLNVAVYILALVLPIILFKRSKHEI